MVIELSGNYTAILPVIISTMIAYGISRAYQKVPLFDVLARQDGLVLPSIEERREMTKFVIPNRVFGVRNPSVLRLSIRERFLALLGVTV